MRCLLIILSLILGTQQAFASSEKIKTLLPSPLHSFELHKSKIFEVEKELGPAELKEKQAHYWSRGGLKYALKITFDNDGVLKSIDYTFTEKWPELKKLGKIDTKKIVPYPINGKSAGRFLLYKEKGGEVLIDPVTKTIQSVKLL
jgi:hypothetical protein